MLTVIFRIRKEGINIKKILFKYEGGTCFRLVAVCIYRFVMTRLDYYGMCGNFFFETSLAKQVPEYDVMVLRCYVTCSSCISYEII